MVKLFFFILIFFISISCHRFLKDDNFSFPRKNYTGNYLKINGYFFHQFRNNPDYIEVYFFYKNGVALQAGSFKKSELNDYLIKFSSSEWINNIKKYKAGWGIFNISGNSIKLERWYPSDPPLKAYISEGEILSDTSFVFKKQYRSVGGKETEVETLNDLYEFKAFSPKPDSTNGFIP